MRKRRVAIMLLIALAVSAAAEAKDLAAGATAVEIRLPLGLPMGGFGARVSGAAGRLDPLMAKILVLEGNDQSVALVTLDLHGNFPDSQLDEVRSRVKGSCGISDVVFNISHTHSSPIVKLENIDEWQKQAVSDIAAGIERAWKAREPARIGIGQGAVRIGHNRLDRMAGANGKMLWRNETRLPTSPVDPTVMVLRVDRIRDGSALAVAVNYACHPVVLGPESLDYSADFPGEMMKVVESQLPGNPVCMYIQGAAGDINPYHDKTAPAENAVALMRETGRTLAQEALRVARRIETRPAADAELRVHREYLDVRPRWNREKMMARLSGVKLNDFMKPRVERAMLPSFRAPVTVLLLGREFAFVGVPGEIFTDYQIDLRERVKDFPVLFGGYTNGNLGYIPTIKAAADGGYGANQIGSYIEVNAGGRMINAAIVQLGYWTGKLKDKPAQ